VVDWGRLAIGLTIGVAVGVWIGLELEVWRMRKRIARLEMRLNGTTLACEDEYSKF
jgi:hypothetical protein